MPAGVEESHSGGLPNEGGRASVVNRLFGAWALAGAAAVGNDRHEATGGGAVAGVGVGQQVDLAA